MFFDASWKAVFDPGAANDFFNSTPLGPFQAEAEEYSAINAWWLAEISRLIYKKEHDEDHRVTDGATRDGILRTVGLQELCFIDSGRVQCAIVTATGKTPYSVLVFRGTKGKLTTWLSNLRAHQTRWLGAGQVHSGFLHLFQEIWPGVREQLSRTTSPVFFTGHSLGAAMATLAAALYPPEALYTFGSPRVGNAAFAASLAHVRVYRVVNRCDIVAAMPPSVMTLEFVHVGEPRWIVPDPFARGCARPQEETAAGNAQEPAAPASPSGARITAPRFLLQHAPISYSYPFLTAGRRS
jgi:hypothetical protein